MPRGGGATTLPLASPGFLTGSPTVAATGLTSLLPPVAHATSLASLSPLPHAPVNSSQPFPVSTDLSYNDILGPLEPPTAASVYVDSRSSRAGGGGATEWALPWGSQSLGSVDVETSQHIHAAEISRERAALAGVRATLAHGADAVDARVRFDAASRAALASKLALADALSAAIDTRAAQLSAYETLRAGIAAGDVAREEADAAGAAALQELRLGELRALAHVRGEGAASIAALRDAASRGVNPRTLPTRTRDPPGARAANFAKLRKLQVEVREMLAQMPPAAAARALAEAESLRSARASASSRMTTASTAHGSSRAPLTTVAPRLAASDSALARSLGNALIRELNAQGRGAPPSPSASARRSNSATTAAATEKFTTEDLEVDRAGFAPRGARGSVGGGRGSATASGGLRFGSPESTLDAEIARAHAGVMLRRFLGERLADTPYDEGLASVLARTVHSLGDTLRSRASARGDPPLPLATYFAEPKRSLAAAEHSRARALGDSAWAGRDALAPDASEDAWLDAPLPAQSGAVGGAPISGFILPSRRADDLSWARATARTWLGR